jgi:anthranilate synthase/aminodeoxychorismate synthase-like glutamine amidotransferase
MILVIDNYDSFTYNLVQLIGELGFQVKVFRNDKIKIKEIEKLNPEKIIISPGPGRPKDAGCSVEVIKEFAGQIPILGICLGHQSIGAAFGAKIVKAKKLVHGKVSTIINNDLGILKGIGNFNATRYHSLVIDYNTLSDNFKITSKSKDGMIMGIEDEKLSLYGLQFHPESIMTKQGKEIISNFLEI